MGERSLGLLAREKARKLVFLRWFNIIHIMAARELGQEQLIVLLNKLLSVLEPTSEHGRNLSTSRVITV